MSIRIIAIAILVLTIFSKEIDTTVQEETKSSSPQPSTSTEEKEEEELPKYITFPIPYENNEDFLVTALGIGTPRTYFPVQVDTSTSTTWVPSTKCSNCKSYLKYNSSLSNSSIDSEDTVELFDEDGNLKGIITHDDVQVDQYIIKNFTFIQAKELQDNYRDFEDGKLGLGYYHSNKEMSFIEMLKENGLIFICLIRKSKQVLKDLNQIYGGVNVRVKKYIIFGRGRKRRKKGYPQEYKP